MDEKETRPKKREWVKNAAIIFLAVMLVLTFFSNTILNRTLPEVVTRYVEANSIDSKGRISGTVSARENYDVIIDQTRKVAAVNVKLGQEVRTGDVLFTLESGDSAELEQAKKDLEAAQIDYQRLLLNLPDYTEDYAAENREIAQLRTELDKAIAKRDLIIVPSPEALYSAENAITRAQAAVDAAEENVRSADLALKEAQMGVKYSSDGSEQKLPKEYADEISRAKEDRENARVRLKAALLNYDHDKQYALLKETTLGTIAEQKRLNNATKGFAALKSDEKAFLAQVYEEIFFLNAAGFDDKKCKSAVLGRGTAGMDEDLVADMKYVFGSVFAKLKTNDERKTEAECRAREKELIEYYWDALRMMSYYLEKNLPEQDEATRAAYDAVYTAKLDYENALSRLADAVEARRRWLEDNPGENAVLYNGRTHEYWLRESDRLSMALDEATLARDEAQAVLAKATDAYNEMKKVQTDLEAAEAEVELCQQRLEDSLFSLAQKQKSDQKTNGRQQMLDALSIQEAQKHIAELQKAVDEYAGNEFTEVKSKVNGTVATLSVSAGHKAEAGATLATIEVQDLGYTMTSTVSVDQAKLLHVGDTAKVSNYYWGSQTTAVLSGMQPDPKDPRTSRVLTFDLAGDVNAGDQISFSIGERNASYDLVVPNSAMRSDTNGSFVLMITAKNSPLGNRYFATRVDVEVIAADDFNTAVKGALSNMDSVITTSSGNAPVKNGDQVRLADTNNG